MEQRAHHPLSESRSKLLGLALALSASLALGAGLAILLGGGMGQGVQPAARVAPITPTPASPALAATVAVGSATEFPLLANAAAVPHPGQPDRLVIASIGLDSSVLPVGTIMDHGVLEWDTAAFAVGYYLGTGLPGANGNVVLAGHISSPISHKGDVFRHLPQVQPGDMVQVYSGVQEWQYRVSEVRIVEPTAVSVMQPTRDPTLTLLTCYPDGVYSDRFVVVGKLVAQTTAGKSGTNVGVGPG